VSLDSRSRWLLETYTPPRAADAAERDAFREHLRSSIWGGLSGGIVLLTDVILAKTLAAPGWQVTLLSTLGPAANLFSFYWLGQVHGRRKAGFFLLAGLLGRLPLIGLLLASSSGWLILLNFLYAVATALILTSANALLQTRYAEDRRAHYFGLATSAGALASILAAQACGLLLERWEHLFPWLFAAAGLAGLASAYHLYRMESGCGERRGAGDWMGAGMKSVRRRLLPPRGTPAPPGLLSSLRLVGSLLRENPEFARFERNFMIYGFAFLSLLPVLPLYVVNELKMNYHQLSTTKGVLAQLGVVVLSPLLSRALSRLQPLRFTGRVFLLLAFYPLLLWVSTLPQDMARIHCVYLALFFYSMAMAGVNLSWTLGSMHFAGRQDASAFHGIHVALTGVRGLLAPTLGFVLYRAAGSAAVFALSTGLFACAGILMLRQHRRLRGREAEAQAVAG